MVRQTLLAVILEFPDEVAIPVEFLNRPPAAGPWKPGLRLTASEGRKRWPFSSR